MFCRVSHFVGRDVGDVWRLLLKVRVTRQDLRVRQQWRTADAHARVHTKPVAGAETGVDERLDKRISFG
jgi:hypothetical protein